MDRELFRNNILELIRRTSAFLPPDVEGVINLQRKLETAGSKADFALELVAQNIGLAKARSLPICQDTGTIGFYFETPRGVDQLELEELCGDAVKQATAKGYLRQNSVDSVDGTNTGDNLGPGSPVFHWEQTRDANMHVRLILKGGGCENMSAQYSLPMEIQGKRVDRNLEGVRACILDAIWKAQGKGCGPGFIGVAIGGDRASGYDFAKRQLLRNVEDSNSDPALAELEARIMKEANTLDIGPMGFSGKFTVGCCKVGKLNRLPASFFVSVAYMCWAYRRRGVVLDVKGKVVEWLYQAPHEFQNTEPMPDLTLPAANVVRLQTPLRDADVRKLKVGDVVLLDGVVFTGRDAVHKYLHDGGELDVIKNGVIYHCGPVVLKDGDRISRGGCRADDVDPRRTLSGRYHQAFWHQSRDRKRRHGPENAEGMPGARLRLPARHRRRRPDLCSMRAARVERPAGAVRQPGGRLGTGSEELPGSRCHRCAR